MDFFPISKAYNFKGINMWKYLEKKWKKVWHLFLRALRVKLYR